MSFAYSLLTLFLARRSLSPHSRPPSPLAFPFSLQVARLSLCSRHESLPPSAPSSTGLKDQTSDSRLSLSLSPTSQEIWIWTVACCLAPQRKPGDPRTASITRSHLFTLQAFLQYICSLLEGRLSLAVFSDGPQLAPLYIQTEQRRVLDKAGQLDFTRRL